MVIIILTIVIIVTLSARGSRIPEFRRRHTCDFSVNMPLPRLQSSEGKFNMSHEIESVRRSFRRHGSCTFTEVARLLPSGLLERRCPTSADGLSKGSPLVCAE